MQKKLTATLLKKLEPKEKLYRVWDTDMAGFAVRVSPKGRVTFFVRYNRLDSKKDSFTIGPMGKVTLKQARDIAGDVLAAVRRGEDPKTQRKKAKGYPTLKAFMQEFLEGYAHYNVKPKTKKGYAGSIRRCITPHLGGKRIDLIDISDVTRLRNKYRDKPYQANQVLAVLSKAYNWAIEQSLYPDLKNPCEKVSKFGKKHGVKSKERYLTQNELQKLGAVLKRMQEGKPLLKPTEGSQGKTEPLERQYHPDTAQAAVGAILLLMMTGARRGEILNAKWEYVNFENNTLYLPDSKTGEKKIILEPNAVNILRRLYEKRPPGESYVIHGLKKNKGMYQGMGKIWNKVRESAGIDDVRLHDLRHTYASIALSKTKNLKMVSGLLGHSQAATTDKYAHLLDDPLRQAGAATSGEIWGLLSPDDG